MLRKGIRSCWIELNLSRPVPELLLSSEFQGDGWVGLPDEGPFDAIHVGAGAGFSPFLSLLAQFLILPFYFNRGLLVDIKLILLDELPQTLVDQLSKGGIMIIPVGSPSSCLNISIPWSDA